MEEAIAGRVSADVTIDFRQDAWMHVLDMHRLYLDLLEYKAVRGYDHVYIDPSNISRILRRRCTIQVSGAEKWWPEQLQTWASQALQRYMDRFVRMKEREAESRNVEPAYLACDDPRLLQQYVLRVKPGEWFNKIEALLQAGLPRRDDGEPIPRLYMDESLLNPHVDGRRDCLENLGVGVAAGPSSKRSPIFARLAGILADAPPHP